MSAHDDAIPSPADRPAGARRWLAAHRLADQTAGRENNVLAIRLTAASIVILFHCYALTDRWLEEPLHVAFPPMNLAVLGVGTFFVLSGFLVTQSWFARPVLRSYLAARVLRIYPALIAATIFTMLVAGATGALPWRDYLTSPVTWRYFIRTASGYDVVDALPGAFANNPFPSAANGSLWTLPVELRLYAALALAGVAGALARPRVLVPAALVVVGVAAAWPQIVPLEPNTPVTRTLALLFLLGSLACVGQRHVPLSLPCAALAVAIPLFDPFEAARSGPLNALLLSYVVLVIAYHPALRVRAISRAPDYSYGLYVYAFPIQQAIVWAHREITPGALFAGALAASLVVAAISWHLLEAPMLRLKSRFRPPAHHAS